MRRGRSDRAAPRRWIPGITRLPLPVLAVAAGRGREASTRQRAALSRTRSTVCMPLVSMQQHLQEHQLPVFLYSIIDV